MRRYVRRVALAVCRSSALAIRCAHVTGASRISGAVDRPDQGAVQFGALDLSDDDSCTTGRASVGFAAGEGGQR